MIPHACAAYLGSQGCTSEGYKRQKTIRTRSKTLKWQLDLPLSGSSGLSLVAASAGPPAPHDDRFHRCVAVESYASLICWLWFLASCERPYVAIQFITKEVQHGSFFSNILSRCLPGLIQECEGVWRRSKGSFLLEISFCAVQKKGHWDSQMENGDPLSNHIWTIWTIDRQTLWLRLVYSEKYMQYMFGALYIQSNKVKETAPTYGSLMNAEVNCATTVWPWSSLSHFP